MQSNYDSPPISEIEVSGKMSVNEVTKRFLMAFPFLRMEIFYNGKAASHYYPLTPLESLTSKRKLKSVRISPELKVEQLVDLFWENMGVQVAIARKLANSIVDTTFTRGWTLRQQNEVGSEFFTEFEPK